MCFLKIKYYHKATLKKKSSVLLRLYSKVMTQFFQTFFALTYMILFNMLIMLFSLFLSFRHYHYYMITADLVFIYCLPNTEFPPPIPSVWLCHSSDEIVSQCLHDNNGKYSQQGYVVFIACISHTHTYTCVYTYCV